MKMTDKDGVKHEDVKVRVVSQGDRKAEVIVSMPLPGGKVAHETRHLLLGGGGWTDKHGNRYA